MAEDRWCPWCNAIWPHVPVRFHDAGTEFKCAVCDGRHTKKECDPEAAFVFFPGDLYRAIRDDVEPLELGI
jgi:hypothetical protein